MKIHFGGNVMRIGVLMGGCSSERQVSLLTGEEIIKNLNKDKYHVIPIIINSKEEVFEKIKNVDFVFIALHGEFGEDGCIQSILETLNLPYSGSNPLTSALCMNKQQSKRILKCEGINVAKGICLKKSDFLNDSTSSKLRYPLIVKPNNGGSSIGVSLINDKNELNAALEAAFLYCEEVLIEEFLDGKEYTVPILNGAALPTLEISFNSSFFNYEAKYASQDTIEEVASLPKELKEDIEAIAEKSYELLDCKAYARVDIIVSNGKPYVLELNTLPGMTSASLFPKSAKAAHIGFSELLDKIIEYSLNK